MTENNVLEIANDSFYVKKESDCQRCKFAFLHLSEQAHNMYLAFFENSDVDEPIVYWFEEDDCSYNENSRQFIIEFIGEAYLSLYIQNGTEKPVNRPLWKHNQNTDCGIPTNWWNIVGNIKR